MKKREISRRSLIKGALASASLMGLSACGAIPRRALSGLSYIPIGERLNIACIGCGGRGSSDVNGVSSQNIVALCDVDEERAAETFAKYPKARKFKDFRRMLDRMDKEIDAVIVSAPDHIHYSAAMMAILKGKHVFIEKPLTHSIWEARQLARAARLQGVATQMGIQGHAKEGARLLREWVWAGAIGPVHEVHIWTDRPIWPQGLERPQEMPQPPRTLDWDLWLGTAPARPYHSAYLPFNWRGWWDFGTGALGDMGCHMMDAVYTALKLGAPTSVEAVSSPVNEESAPNWSIVTYQFPARGGMPPVKLTWYDGGKQPPRPKDLEPERELPKTGQLLIGEKGSILDGTSYCESPRIIPESKMRDYLPNRPRKKLLRIPNANHYEEWILACKGGRPAGANLEYSGPFTEMVLLGNLAIRTSKKIEWDAVNMRAIDNPEADQYIRTEYRKGWGV